ncbi:transglycosylase SLT domain-containing protein [Streptomyces justiciae]|uniref:Transglycosylase SLT domain-containing protein n=1 Tax=Streptomyces justiciae TaxID=2780140 RepID=A0ABU3LM65_9ACTN|nr:transglycosylase SLT domain-containing protein [Streptomyces justiciae]MDT7840158.1 transglycosylase SLT domain-containing protein [Streptomyces justiciae]
MGKKRLRRYFSANPLIALSVVAASATLAPLASSDPTVQTAPTAADGTSPRLFSAPDKQLGSGYASSSDQIVQATGDAEGLHILAARESDGFSFYEIARLDRKELSDVGPWTGYVCTTGSGNYAAAVYAPSVWSNEPGAYESGAFAAVIRLSDGKVTEVPDRVQLAYFTPGCGTGDEVAFTSSSATDRSVGATTVISVDAATGSVSSRRTINGHLTHVTPTQKGTVGVLGGNLVGLKGDGKKLSARKLAAVPGPMFALTASKNGSVDVGTVDGESSVISRFDGKDDFTELGRAPKGKVKLLPVAGGDAIVGDVRGIDTSEAPGLAKHAVDGRVVGISRQGHLVTNSVFSEQMKGITTTIGSPSDEGVGSLTVKATALKTGAKATSLVDADRERPTPDSSLSVDPAAFVMAGPDDTDPLTCGEGGPESQCLSGSGAAVYGKIAEMETPCIVKRNDPKRQALQASANMVEWAVDQAVHGQLTVSRPADWHDTGLGAYTPQGLFEKPKLTGGGEIPAQIMLGVLAQESNFKQASWHSVNGDSGNVTKSDWFGNGNGIHYYPDRASADCGYGIAQVTTRMSEKDTEQYDALHSGAITTDYAANIAAGLQILGEKWNQLKALGMNTNNGDPAYIENWYMALWGYNSGVYTSGSVGLGYFNNPIKPEYPADREPFLRYSYDDASHPGDWSYQEKILGWAETPQMTWDGVASYVKPDMPFDVITVAPRDAFCDPSVNACDPDAADPCPSWDSSCYWDSSVDWMGSQSTANSSTETLRYALGSGEPELQSKYGHGPCIDHPSVYTNAIIVDDLGEHENTYDCADIVGAYDGKFTLQTGDSITMKRDDGTFRATPYIAPIDLHQLGAGYDHHVWFTHSYGDTDYFHKITGRWEVNPAKLPSGDQPGQRYKVYIHLPSHGAEAIVRYNFIPGDNAFGAEADYCRVNQGTRSNGQETWFEMGTFSFWKGGRIEADNLHDAGTGDDNVVFDAIAFVPFSSADPGACALNDGGL